MKGGRRRRKSLLVRPASVANVKVGDTEQKLSDYWSRLGSGSALASGSAVVFLVVLNLFVFRNHWRHLSSFPYDFVASYYAFTAYWITSLQMGEWPHWIPYQ